MQFLKDGVQTVHLFTSHNFDAVDSFSSLIDQTVTIPGFAKTPADTWKDCQPRRL